MLELESLPSPVSRKEGELVCGLVFGKVRFVLVEGHLDGPICFVSNLGIDWVSEVAFGMSLSGTPALCIC